MFGLMKNLMKEAPPPADAVTLAELHTGCVVGFGFMPQKSISGKRVPVTEVNSYLFDADSFISCRLSDDGTDVNLIVADGDDPTGTFLAISQKIEPRLFESIFSVAHPQYWFALKEGERVDAKPPVLGNPQGWLTSRYTLLISTSGRYLEGDWRMRKLADRGRFSRPFEYVLLVDEDNEHALEAEKFEDGTLNVFATVYRPATDIGEITRAPRSVSYGSVESIPHVSLADIAKPAQEKLRETQELVSVEPASEKAFRPAIVEIKPKPAPEEALKPPLAESAPEAVPADTAKTKAEENKSHITQAVVAVPVAGEKEPEAMPKAAAEIVAAAAKPDTVSAEHPKPVAAESKPQVAEAKKPAASLKEVIKPALANGNPATALAEAFRQALTDTRQERAAMEPDKAAQTKPPEEATVPSPDQKTAAAAAMENRKPKAVSSLLSIIPLPQTGTNSPPAVAKEALQTPKAQVPPVVPEAAKAEPVLVSAVKAEVKLPEVNAEPVTAKEMPAQVPKAEVPPVVPEAAKAEPAPVSALKAEVKLPEVKAEPVTAKEVPAQMPKAPISPFMTQAAKAEAKLTEVKAEPVVGKEMPAQIPKAHTPPAAPVEAKVELSLVSSPDVVPLHSKFGRIRPANAQDQSASPADTLACDLPLAGRLIDEAQRNQMLLSELVRKVIDLPARVQDQVLIPFALDGAEVAELARRYNVPAGDMDAVKHHIIEELKRFVGEKK
jgi:hypothetical protein